MKKNVFFDFSKKKPKLIFKKAESIKKKKKKKRNSAEKSKIDIPEREREREREAKTCILKGKPTDMMPVCQCPCVYVCADEIEYLRIPLKAFEI